MTRTNAASWTFVFALLAVLAGPVAATADTVAESFESGFGPWRANADIQREWSATRTTAQAHQGFWSINITADGLNDDGTVWIFRQLRLPPGTHHIGLTFHVWKGGEGIVNVNHPIGFIGLREPRLESDFNSSPEGTNFFPKSAAGWSSYSMSRTLNVTSTSTAWVAVGYDITFEDFVTHHFDSITLTGIPTQCGDGVCFFGEDSCNCPADCGSLITAEVCDDGADNDCDGFPDCHDTDCAAAPECQPGCNFNGFCDELETHQSCGADCAGGFITFCNTNGICDQYETSCDCPDDCGPPAASEVPGVTCTDGLDNDCDFAADCNDPDCATDPACQTPPCNNNGVCDAGEDCNGCPADCIAGSSASCGNGICEAADGEDCANCPADCRGVQSGNPNNRYCCGAGGGQNPVGCNDPRCNASGFTCTDAPAVGSCCGDEVCEGIEDSDNCEVDCPAPLCGDGTCDASENRCTCPADCGSPPATETNCTDGIDNDCDGLIDCNDADCASAPACQSSCGNGTCEPGENCQNCAADCPGRQSGPPSGRYCCGNGVLEGPEGDGSICDGNP